jgi:hypothetical protein
MQCFENLQPSDQKLQPPCFCFTFYKKQPEENLHMFQKTSAPPGCSLTLCLINYRQNLTLPSLLSPGIQRTPEESISFVRGSAFLLDRYNPLPTTSNHHWFLSLRLMFFRLNTWATDGGGSATATRQLTLLLVRGCQAGVLSLVAILNKDGIIHSDSTSQPQDQENVQGGAYTKETSFKKLLPCNVKLQMHESRAFIPDMKNAKCLR